MSYLNKSYFIGIVKKREHALISLFYIFYLLRKLNSLCKGYGLTKRGVGQAKV